MDQQEMASSPSSFDDSFITESTPQRKRRSTRKNTEAQLAKEMLRNSSGSMSELKALLNVATQQLLREEQRANDAEARVRELTSRMKDINDAKRNAVREAERAIGLLNEYKARYEEALKEIQLAQKVYNEVDERRRIAEKEAADAKATIRNIAQQHKVHNAREEGRARGIDEGWQHGQQIVQNYDLPYGYPRTNRTTMYTDYSEEVNSSSSRPTDSNLTSARRQLLSRTTNSSHIPRTPTSSDHRDSMRLSEPSRDVSQITASFPESSLLIPQREPTPPTAKQESPLVLPDTVMYQPPPAPIPPPIPHYSRPLQISQLIPRHSPPHPPQISPPIPMPEPEPKPEVLAPVPIAPPPEPAYVSQAPILSIPRSDIGKALGTNRSPSQQSLNEVEIRPIIVHNYTPFAPPSPIRSPIYIPPDNFIPELGADGEIHLPPPHEFYRQPTPEPASPRAHMRAVSELGVGRMNYWGQPPSMIYHNPNARTRRRRRSSDASYSNTESVASTTLSEMSLVKHKSFIRSPMSDIPEVRSSIASPNHPPEDVNGGSQLGIEQTISSAQHTPYEGNSRRETPTSSGSSHPKVSRRNSDHSTMKIGVQPPSQSASETGHSSVGNYVPPPQQPLARRVPSHRPAHKGSSYNAPSSPQTISHQQLQYYQDQQPKHLQQPQQENYIPSYIDSSHFQYQSTTNPLSPTSTQAQSSVSISPQRPPSQPMQPTMVPPSGRKSTIPGQFGDMSFSSRDYMSPPPPANAAGGMTPAAAVAAAARARSRTPQSQSQVQQPQSQYQGQGQPVAGPSHISAAGRPPPQDNPMSGANLNRSKSKASRISKVSRASTNIMNNLNNFELDEDDYFDEDEEESDYEYDGEDGLEEDGLEEDGLGEDVIEEYGLDDDVIDDEDRAVTSQLGTNSDADSLRTPPTERRELRGVGSIMNSIGIGAGVPRYQGGYVSAAGLGLGLGQAPSGAGSRSAREHTKNPI